MSEGPVHVRFDRSRTVRKLTQGVGEYRLETEAAERAAVKEHLKLAYTAMREMQGNRFDLQITILKSPTEGEVGRGDTARVQGTVGKAGSNRGG